MNCHKLLLVCVFCNGGDDGDRAIVDVWDDDEDDEIDEVGLMFCGLV